MTRFSSTLVLVIILISCTLLTVCASEENNALVVRVPKPETYDFAVFGWNLFTCHVIPFWIYAVSSILAWPEFFTIPNALKTFFCLYLRDTLITEAINHFAYLIFPSEFLYENGSLVMFNVMPFCDLSLPGYTDPFSTYNDIMSTSTSLTTRKIILFLVYIPSEPSVFDVTKIIWLIIWACLPLRYFGNIFGAFYMLASIGCLLGAVYDTTLNGPFSLPRSLLNAYLFYNTSMGFIYYNVGRTSLFDPHYSDYHILMAMTPEERAEKLGIELNPDKEHKRSKRKLKQAVKKARKDAKKTKAEAKNSSKKAKKSKKSKKPKKPKKSSRKAKSAAKEDTQSEGE